eukprot:XP_024454442.1 uncharacterized protein LOC18097449 isoform X4 [Populus trichocarpa]
MVTSSRLTWLVLEVMELQRLSFQRETLETSDICSPPVQCTQLLARVSFFRVRTWAKFLKHQRIGQREISKSLLLLMGTNNEKLLNDEFYIGLGERRVTRQVE